MKNYIIYLPKYTSSVNMANNAIHTGKLLGWDVELYEGVDGSIADWCMPINQLDAKCRSAMERPGVRGCFLSHFNLWKLCLSKKEPIGIFEHDITFVGPPPAEINFSHLLKLEGFFKKKPRPAGEWYEGARAYILTPEGAERLILWTQKHGALPADVIIGNNILNIELDLFNRVVAHQKETKEDKRKHSFTWNLEGMT